MDHPDDCELHAWLDEQPAAWLAGQLKDLALRDHSLRLHLWQCRRNAQPDRWSPEDLLDRFVAIARPGEFRGEDVEGDEIATIERFIEQLRPLAEREPPLPGFAEAMARIVEIMQPMFEDWGEGHGWQAALIEAMRIHAAACERDPAAAAALPAWLERRAAQRSWPLERAWILEAYGEGAKA